MVNIKKRTELKEYGNNVFDILNSFHHQIYQISYLMNILNQKASDTIEIGKMKMKFLLPYTSIL